MPVRRLLPLGVVFVVCIHPATGLLRATQDAPARTLDGLLDRAAIWLADYAVDLSSLVAEEHYRQRMRVVKGAGFDNAGAAPTARPLTGTDYSRPVTTTPLDVMPASVEMVSDVLMVQVAGSAEWVPFRDVISVNGRPVRDREERLATLFLEPTASTVARARAITRESARYNVGPVDRTINVPTLALSVLSARNQARFEFSRDGDETVDGVRAWKVAYRERGSPTLIATTDGVDLPASGRLWVDQVSGAVVRTELRTSAFGVRSEVTVSYTFEPSVGARVPAEMVERYERQGGMGRSQEPQAALVATDDRVVVDATATYANFRRFVVRVDETLLGVIRR